MFMGEYRHSIDDKGRLAVPSKFRNELGNEFVVTRGLDKCLFVYKLSAWKDLINEYKNLPNTKDARNFMRFFMSGAVSTNLDKQGRANIANNLISYAELDKECVVIGVNDRIEIWNSSAWDLFVLENESKMSDIAEKLFDVKNI